MMGSKLMSVCLYGFGMILLFPFIHGVTKDFYYSNKKRTWADARQYCREYYTDLATVDSAEDLKRMPATGREVWIGLHDDPAAWYQAMTSDPNSWRWSTTGTTSPGGYQDWTRGEPDFSKAAEFCAALDENGWHDRRCDDKITPVCYQVQSNNKQFILGKSKMTWAQSRDHCRKHYKNLAMIESLAENQAVKNLVGNGVAWIGLYREPWTWSDNSDSSFRNWARKQPNNWSGQRCVTMSSDLTWNDYHCRRRMPFICYKGRNQQTDREQLLRLLEEKLMQQNPNADFKVRWTTLPEKLE